MSISKISDYENLEAFKSDEFDDVVEKSAAFKQSIKNYTARAKTKAIDIMVDRSIKKYEDRNEELRNKFDRYPAATAPSQEIGESTAGFNKLMRTLDIVFTPFSVIITSKSGVKKLVIQTIDVQDMKNEMLDAWKRKDASYFRRYMAAKMKYSKIMLEQRMALNGLRDSLEFQKSFSKNASELVDEYDEDFEFLNIPFFAESYKDADDDILDKLAMTACIETGDVSEFISPTSNNEAFLSIINELGFIPDTIDFSLTKTAAESLSVDKVQKDVKIIFLEDRVIYALGNFVLTEILADKMSMSDALSFKNKDKKYFEDKLLRQALVYNQKRNYYGLKPLEKRASVKQLFSISSIFEFDFIPPIVYKLVLDKKLGKAWFALDEFVIIKTVENKFRIDVISNSALNKIMSIAAVLSEESDLAFTSKHAFEKIIRAFNDLPIDFEQREIESIDANKLSYGIECLIGICGELALEKLGPDVIQYIVDTLVYHNMYAYYPNTDSMPETQIDFISVINQLLLKSIIRRDIDGILDKVLEDETEKNDEIIQAGIVESIEFIRSGQAQNESDIENYIANLCSNLEVDARFVEIIKSQIEKNLSIDVFLNSKKKNLEAYITLFKIGG